MSPLANVKDKRGETMGNRRQRGFTLIEVLIVVVIMAVLAATVIPQFSTTADDAKTSTLKYNLHALRSAIELYKLHHNGALPAVANDTDGNPSLPQLYSASDASGAIGTPGPSYPFGPYILNRLPNNPLNGDKNVIVTTSSWPPTAETSAGGWFYQDSTGQIGPNAAGHLTD
jgi:prepilin-type N-terminal cleavage/methylation domain-containing protein